MNKTLYIIIVLLLASLTAYPQGNNAVNITIMGSGSYSSKLSDFYTSSNAGMLTVIIRNQDYKEAQIPVQLFMSITHSFDKQPYITTKNPNPTRIINLKSNDALVLTGKDLECLFNTAYLTYKGPNLKDGSNILKIYARDIRTGKVVSNTASLSLRSVTIQPPRLVSPDNRLVYETDNQFMTFRWKGDDTYKAVTHNYVYCLEIWRQMSDNPYVDTIRTPEIITADNLKTENYQLALPMYPMEIGGRYCWRVRAHDPSGRATFSQNGWSEVRSFTYKHLPVPVTGLTHTIKQTTRRATVTWDGTEGHTKYYIEYYNPQTQKTISNTTAEPRYELAAAPDSEYKILFRVKAQCWGDDSRTSDWTRWDTISYAARKRVESEYECGHKFPRVEVTNLDLKTDFEEGDIVREANGSSEYEIINYASEPDGTLRGQFYLVMNAWGGAKIACEFWDTKINTDNVVITTRYRSIDLPGYVADPDEIQRYVKEIWLDANSVATSSKIRDTIVIPEKFDYLYAADDGTLYAVVVNPDGTVTETEVRTNKSTSQCLVTDGQGDSLVISKGGQPMGIQEYRATGGNKALLKEYHRKSDSLAQWQINFKKYDAQAYAFDRVGSGDHGIFDTDEYYPRSGSYDFRYKSVECGKTDRVVVDFGSYSEKDSVIFKDKYGVRLKVVDQNVLAFTGVSRADTNYIYAYRGDKKIGKLFLNTYQRKTYKVVLVSVNGATLPSESIILDSLNKVYNQCAVSFELRTDTITINGLKSFSHGGSGILTVYNDDQKTVLTAYDKWMQNNTYYLFFIDNVKDKKDGSGTLVSGYMPRGYNAGFIYEGGSERTIAHELGHGVAGLEHVFSDSKASGKTQNLMDYATGEQLWHFQWNQIQDPSRVWMKWNKDEGEGELLTKRSDTDTRFYLLLVNKKDSIFYSAGETIYLNTNTEYTFKIIKRHKFDVPIDDNNKVIHVVTDIVFNEIEWKWNENNQKSAKFTIKTSEVEHSTTIEAKININNEIILGYFDNNIFKRVNNEAELPSNVTSYKRWTFANLIHPDELKDTEAALAKFKNINIQVINDPSVEFVRSKDYKGEYGFDNDFWTTNKSDCYLSEIIHGSNYVYPWVSMKKDQMIHLQAVVHIDENFVKTPNSAINISSDDENMSISPNVIRIVEKGKKSKDDPTSNLNVVTITNPKNKEFLTLELKCSSNDLSLKNPHTVFATKSASNQIIGGFKYYSRDYANFKEANLYIYTFFFQEGNKVEKEKLEDFLNNYSFNQAFVKWNVFIIDKSPDIDKIKEVRAYYEKNNNESRMQFVTDLIEGKRDNIIDEFLGGFLLLYCENDDLSKQMEGNNYVLFVTDLESSNQNEDGYAKTPTKNNQSNNNYGVIFKNGINNFSTYVHEMGHIIGFQHTFETEPDYLGGNRGTKKSTENFMDYSDSKLMLWKTDWEQILNYIDK
ncbi:MAG: hypothetical protein J6V76_07160 [Bacteroidales bacterium]|nr:hypothetical protein [Bacteroidales bacterium]